MRDFSPYFRSTIGFDQLFNQLEQAVEAGNGYPPYNIERSDETHYRISVAVAGFAEKDLAVEVRDGDGEVGEPRFVHDPVAPRHLRTRRLELHQLEHETVAHEVDGSGSGHEP